MGVGEKTCDDLFQSREFSEIVIVLQSYIKQQMPTKNDTVLLTLKVDEINFAVIPIIINSAKRQHPTNNNNNRLNESFDGAGTAGFHGTQ